MTDESAIWMIRWLLGHGLTNQCSEKQVVMIQRASELRKAYGREDEVVYTEEEETPFHLERQDNVLYNQPGVEEPYTGRTIYLREGGVKRRETHYLKGRKHGPAITYFWTGHIESDSSYSDGHLHGRSRRWHANGVQAGECTYSNGVATGAAFEWDEQGGRSRQTDYSIGQRVKVTTWHTNGQARSVTRFAEGKRHGAVTNWNQDGVAVSVTIYKDGEWISARSTDWDSRSRHTSSNGVVIDISI